MARVGAWVCARTPSGRWELGRVVDEEGHHTVVAFVESPDDACQLIEAVFLATQAGMTEDHEQQLWETLCCFPI